MYLLLLHYAIEAIHRRPEQRAAPKHTHSVLDARLILERDFLFGRPDGFLDGFCFSKWLFDGSQCS
jgi:hypothetical protein